MSQNIKFQIEWRQQVSEVIVNLISVALGFASGLLVPWVKWQMEKQKKQFANRGEAIKSWRAAIEAEEHDVADSRSKFLSLICYSSLRTHLTTEAITKIEAARTIHVSGMREGYVRNQLLLDEVSRLEKKWGLV